MKNYTNYLIIIFLFILFDAFQRSFHHAFYVGDVKNSIIEFLRALFFYMFIFIIKSWFYIPVAALFLIVSSIFKRDQLFFIIGGLVMASGFYLSYCKLYSPDESGSLEFYIRILVYSFMGAYFGSVRFKTIDKTL